MFNPYMIVLGLFVVAGLLATLWGLRIIVQARRTAQWPTVQGIIEKSIVTSNDNDLLPNIIFCYEVNGQAYQRSVEFPRDVTPSQEFASSYVDRYPEGSHVLVYYNPENPENATLEPGLGQGDWLVFAIGLGMLVFGILFLAFGG